MNAGERQQLRAFFLLIALGLGSGIAIVLVNGCSAQQLDALREVRELAGDVCLAHDRCRLWACDRGQGRGFDGWEACLKKCEAEKEKRDAPAAGP